MAPKDKVDSLLRDAADRGAVPGVIAMTTDKGGITYAGAFGKRVLGESAPMTADTVVWIASMTKALTGAAAMQLVERGKLSLDAPASSVLPRLGEAGVLEGFDAEGKPRLRAPKRPITLRHLLTHTAGFAYEFFNADIGRYQSATETPGVISCANAALTTPLVFDPGERWEYGICIDWAGKMVEAVTGKKLGAALRDGLFGPLGMHDTAFFITPAMRSRLAKIHQRGDDDALVPQMELELPQEPEFEMGGGGLYGTVGDYLKFVRMVLNRGRADGGAQVLRPETVELMSCNAMGNVRVTMLKSVAPQFSNDAELFPGIEKSWGLSFQINEADAPTGLPKGSLMWAGMANSYDWIDPKNGIGGAYATQVLPFADKHALPLFLDFQRAVYDRLH